MHEFSRRAVCSILALLLIAASAVSGQSYVSAVHDAPVRKESGTLSKLQLKQLFERHFESAHPVVRPWMYSAVPGSKLIQEHSLRAERLKDRLQALASEHPHAVSSSTALPGVQLRPTLPAGAIPTAVATGDFNGDGKMDFVIANGDTNDLWIYLGNGDGTFKLPQIIPLSKGVAPVYLAAADLRHTGFLDLVVAELDTSTVGVLLGNGDGTFGYEQTYTLPQPPAALVVDDFNHDGKLDVAAVMETVVAPTTRSVPYLAVLTGDGTGNFAPPVITNNWGFYSTAWNVSSADVNGDGLPDLLITGPDLDNSTIYLNNGDGTFKQGQAVVENTAYNAVVDGRLGDVNGDGCPDAVIADVIGVAWVSLGDCSGNFAAPTYIATGASNAAVRLADVNGDGNLDIITASVPVTELNGGNTFGNTLNVSFGDGKGNFNISHTYPGPGEAYSLAEADFNGDGKADFVTANSDTDTATVYQNDGTGYFGFPQGIATSGSSQGGYLSPFQGQSFADLNGDGKPDVFLLSIGPSGDYYATSYLNDGTGRLANPISSDIGVPFPNIFLGDYRLGNFRGTGHQDLIAIGQDVAYTASSQTLVFAPGNGDGSFGKPVVSSVPNADGAIATGDFNGDGKLDFVAVNGADTHTLAPFLGNGDGSFRAGTPITFTDGAASVSRVFTGDYNGDGKLDVLAWTTGNGYWTTASAVWEFDGNGDGTFQPGRELYTDFQPFTMADVNGDGRQDIARYDFMWPDGSTETLGPARFTTYLGQSNGTFRQSSSYAPYSGTPKDVVPFLQFGDPLAVSIVSDMNGDGKPDEVAFQTGDGQYAQILMGNGDGTFTPTYDVFPFYGLYYPFYGHDLNGDGFTDLLEVDEGVAAMHLFKGAPGPAVQIALQDAIVTGNGSCGWVFPDIVSASDQTVTLSSSVPGVNLPSSVTIPANATNVKFCYTLASNFNWRQVFDVNAQLNGDTATAYASDSYIFGFDETVSPTTTEPIYAGQITNPMTVTLTAATGYNSTVTLSCEGLPAGSTCQFGSDTLQVSSAATISTTFMVNLAATALVSPSLTFNVVASDGNVTRQSAITIPVAILWVDETNSSTFMTASPGSASSTVQVSGIPPYSLSCSGLPAGATCSFSGNQAPYPGLSIITTNVSVGSGIPTGSYPFEIVANSGPATSSANATLQVVSFSVQGPSVNNDWAVVGGEQNIPVTVQESSNLDQFLTINCSLDSGGTCIGPVVTWGSTSQTVQLNLSVPSGTTIGQHQLSVTAALGSSVSQTYTFPIIIADYTGSLSASSVTLNSGSTGTLTATLNATTGFNDAVTLFCSGALQISCSFSPSTVQLASGTPQSVAITLSTGAIASMPSRPSKFKRNNSLAFACVFPIGITFGVFRRRRLGAIVLLAFLLPFLSSCGSNGNSGSGGGNGSSPGAYSLTIIAVASDTGTSRTLGTVNVTVK